MPYKDKETQKQAQRVHYRKNKCKYLDNQRRRRERLRAWFKQYKSTLKCQRCVEKHPACLQFHHLDRKTKEIDVAQAISAYWSIDKIMNEISKCEVLCANCHAKEHWTE